MRGGKVNHERVRVFLELLDLLYSLNVLHVHDYKMYKQNALFVNPLVRSQQYFIDPFEE